MEKFDSIKAIVDAVKSGALDESQIEVVMDNDCSSVYYGTNEDASGNEVDNQIYEGAGYFDVEELWPLVFPKASVGWC